MKNDQRAELDCVLELAEHDGEASVLNIQKTNGDEKKKIKKIKIKNIKIKIK